MSKFTAQWHGMGVQFSVQNNRPTDPLTKICKQEILTSGLCRQVAQGQCPNFLDQENGQAPDLTQPGGEIDFFQPMQVGRKQSAPRGFVDDPWNADQDPPQVGMCQFTDDRPHFFKPGFSRGGGSKLMGPLVLQLYRNWQSSDSGLSHTDFNDDETRAPIVQSQQLARPPEFGLDGFTFPAVFRCAGPGFLQHT